MLRAWHAILLFALTACLMSSHVLQAKEASSSPLSAKGIQWLTIPENREDPGSNTIEVAYLRLAAKGGSKRLPLVFIAGGPGVSGIDRLLA